mmetsp:Transcript_11162/g.18748  ORF Transcript_11162/g.18748 Transcript_11162/m.18748 type:complete len:123 (-) Transcript_11162:110-478(-)|eukprot:CAMPEP_0168628494 /NCGR_PEP_ID=MMETSP0449_2-20121227/11879_1 /TAXON_ID=1082188 /ORGANISM="Strombidium rassoulzadegani, Strain ras09" /LENGTH=122 /DNA_ID=CAMNT_0008670927 /DNA_START=317 /DNA_END=685 /DNA_ORIENTATION=+
MSAAFFAIFATFYIVFKLKKEKIFSVSIYKKFVVACMSVIVTYCLLISYFTLKFVKLSKTKLINYLYGFKAISMMQSDSSFRNVLEFFCTICLIFGFYALIFLSYNIENQISQLDKMKEKPN